jgi:16S rRNA pseudouridine516 synthase
MKGCAGREGECGWVVYVYNSIMKANLDLERILHRQGFGSRRKCRILIANGEVTVAGTVITDPGAVFATESLEFGVGDETWRYREQVYLLMNKPAHFECSRNPQHHPSIYRLLPEPLVERGVQAIGRLDEDTTGLLLFSDDGQYIHRVSSPKHKVDKVYRVTLKHPWEASDLVQLKTGVQLDDEPQPIQAEAAVGFGELEIELTIREGKYHQVKRMIAAIGNRVEALARIRIGALELPPDLTPGKWRWMEPDALG